MAYRGKYPFNICTVSSVNIGAMRAIKCTANNGKSLIVDPEFPGARLPHLGQDIRQFACRHRPIIVLIQRAIAERRIAQKLRAQGQTTIAHLPAMRCAEALRDARGLRNHRLNMIEDF